MSLHTDHKYLMSVAALGFLFLSFIITILPAFEAQKTPSLDGMQVRSDIEEKGRQLYLIEGCGFCHTQFVRDLEVDKPYGRESVAGDYSNEVPPLLGTQRTGPDLSNVGIRQPSDVWNLIHLYNPRAVVPESVMPGYPWYFIEKTEADPIDVIVPIPDEYKPKDKIIVPTDEAIALVAYMKSLKQVQLKP